MQPAARAIRGLIDVDGGPLVPDTIGKALQNQDLLHAVNSIGGVSTVRASASSGVTAHVDRFIAWARYSTKGHVTSIHALPMAAQRGVWALVSEVRGRLRAGLVPDGGFSIGFLDGMTAVVPVPHTVIHVVPRRAGENVELPECGEWIADDGVVERVSCRSRRAGGCDP